MKTLFAIALSFFVLNSYLSAEPPKREHALIGAWLSSDDTIFHFREDGTFHGIDFKKREIWGSWVTLSRTRIGFQSLLHSSYYAPQYAIINQEDKNKMDYIVSDGTSFISAVRIDPKKAQATIETMIQNRLHNPSDSE